MNTRDLDLLSSYLDGQLKPSESARLEARLSRDSDLRAVLDDLRAARGLLRQLPMRKAPRNFTLTPKMVGKNPPLPRSYPAFRFVTALASLMLFFSMGLNFIAPQMASQSPNFGYGGGGAPEVFSAQAPAEESAAATAAPAVEAPSAEMVPQPTATIASAADSSRELQTPVTKEGVTGDAPAQTPPETQNEQVIPPVWLIVMAAIAVLGAFVMVMMRQSAVSRWRRK
jgi:hypothetical protein